MVKYIVIALIVIAIVFMGYMMGVRSENAKPKDSFATKDTSIRDLLALDEGIEELLAKRGMHCTGCPSAVSETVEQACTVHNLDVDEILTCINDYLEDKQRGNQNI